MKKLMLSTAVFAALGHGALAQADTTGPFSPSASQGEIRASELIGKRVYAADTVLDGAEYDGLQSGWNDIGEINDVLISRDGKIDAVLVDIGGFLGIGERQVAVTMPSIRFVADSSTADAPDDFFLVMTADRATLEGAPAFTWEQGTMTGDDTAATGDQAAAAAGTDAEAMTAKPANEAATTGTAANDTAADAATGTEATGTATARAPMQVEGFSALPADTLTAAEVTGARVYDSADTWIGEVSDLIVGDGDKITHVVVDVGGFLGIGEKPVSLAIGDIDILRQTDGTEVRVYVSMTREGLEQLPTYAK